MHTETADRQAFELVAIAMEKLDDYIQDRQLSYLREAESALQKAIDRDSQYLSAAFYAGIVKDLIGKPVEAVPFFDKILSNLPTDSEHRRDEIQYSRGVAWYHRYSHKYLAQAEQDFLAVVNRTKQDDLRLLARAGLAQAYAMWMIPNSSQKARLLVGHGDDELDFIREKRTKCLEQIELVRAKQTSPDSSARSNPPTSLLSGPIQGTALNAHGMCTMYWTDYNVKEIDEKRRLLQKAVGYLESADKYLPGDWANTCDIGSAHFRMGVLEQVSGGNPSAEFQKAVELFQKVIDDLRPNYGFAFYEMGRIYRVWGQFDDAKTSFHKSLGIPAEYRDVGDGTVNTELHRSEKHDCTFP